MPTFGRAGAASREDVTARVAAATCGAGTTGTGVGLELELFPVTSSDPSRRLRLHRAIAGRPPVAELLRAARADAAVDGATLTVEPGAQVEVATGCCQRPTDALDQLERVTGRLAGRFHAHGARLLAVGHDVWHPLADVPQQLARPRYRAMDAYLAARSPDGPRMMRHTAALQVNLDLGVGPDREERWQVCNLLAPLTTATFATSPAPWRGGTVRSRRALSWRRLDPTRTGVPAGVVHGRGTLEEHVFELAWHADVLLLPTADGDARPGVPGWTFADWVRDGHPQVGSPTDADVDEHLTTLFPEVRARGFVELRGLDALPARHRRAAVLLLAGAVLDPRARAAIRAVLEPHRSRLPSLLSHAARVGLSDPRLCAMAVEVWSYARDGAARLPGVAGRDVAAIDRFVDLYTVRGRCPADELAELLVRDPVAARRWATEPIPTVTEVS